MTDPLTAPANRNQFNKKLDDAISHGKDRWRRICRYPHWHQLKAGRGAPFRTGDIRSVHGSGEGQHEAEFFPQRGFG